jgi:hypothetical protein
MTPTVDRLPKTEGRRGARIDADEGGSYVGIPLNHPFTCSVDHQPRCCPENRVRYSVSKHAGSSRV